MHIVGLVGFQIGGIGGIYRLEGSLSGTGGFVYFEKSFLECFNVLGYLTKKATIGECS